MIDRAFRLLVRNYWSVFFVVAMVAVPIHLVYATIWRHVIAVAELHGDIAQFPPLRQVRGVGRAQLDEAMIAQWVIVAVEIALIPLFLRATRRILEADERGEPPTALDGWRSALGRGEGLSALRLLTRRPSSLVAGAAVAAAVYLLMATLAGVLVDPVAPAQTFAWAGLAEGAARAAAAPFFLVLVAAPSRRIGRTRE